MEIENKDLEEVVKLIQADGFFIAAMMFKLKPLIEINKVKEEALKDGVEKIRELINDYVRKNI